MTMSTRPTGSAGTLDLTAEAATTAAIATARMPIIVGVDDSPGASAAVEWAAVEAAQRGVELRILHAWSWQRLEPWSSAIDRRVIADLRNNGWKLVSQYAEIARQQGATAVTTHVLEGYAPDVLTATERHTGLLIVGSHRLRSPHRMVIGSVANAVTARAACPTVVAWGPRLVNDDAAVIVGVAGDPTDEDVLAFAFEHARRHRLPVRALHCWQPATFADHRLHVPEQAAEWLAEAVAGWRQDYPDVPLDASVLRAHPVDGLVEAAHGQNLLVVGRRSRHRFATLLGSTCVGAVHSAECPVAVIPPRRAAH